MHRAPHVLYALPVVYISFPLPHPDASRLRLEPPSPVNQNMRADVILAVGGPIC